ncbi:hypothetical protein K505DRAFT_333518 [Melanomma pulvis-pyrius CBS 109.77]|uniref:Uncharacterized protein n=1 Tax=Melanomma pulvis-pyrius CBS 109.77 TaxID=1314802 RepID=A0A6A6XRY4_9PLEO|nr:hypothetical protein K505DRAFT_333518 [Melanomma pulvis-pyrius CBS 109.77]
MSSRTSSSLLTNSLAVSSFTPPPILRNDVQRVQLTANPPRQNRYRLAPGFHEPVDIPIPRNSRDWNYDSSHGCTLPDEVVTYRKPTRVHNVKDDITDYCKPGDSFWSAAHEKRVANTEAQIEACRMTSQKPFQEASRRHSPFYTGQPVKRKDVAIVPERLPAKHNIRALNCGLWMDLRKAVGPMVASTVFECHAFCPKKEVDDGWLEYRDMVLRYEMREEERRRRGRERYMEGLL